MVIILIEGPKTLSVNYDHGQGLIIRGGEDLFPEPEALSTWIDGGPYLKPFTSAILGQGVQKEAVQYVVFPCAVLPANGNYCYLGLDL